MGRINHVTDAEATEEQAEIFVGIKSSLGMVPNFLRVLANSPDALKAFLGLHHIAEAGALDPKTRERIALALAQQNMCAYCVSAHTAMGRKAGLEASEILESRRGELVDNKAAAAVEFAKVLASTIGGATAMDFQRVRLAGYSDAEITEIIVHVGLNTLTNIIGKASQVEIDFPRVSLDLEKPIAA